MKYLAIQIFDKRTKTIRYFKEFKKRKIKTTYAPVNAKLYLNFYQFKDDYFKLEKFKNRSISIIQITVIQKHWSGYEN